jgi:hypothetical protein
LPLRLLSVALAIRLAYSDPVRLAIGLDADRIDSRERQLSEVLLTSL